MKRAIFTLAIFWVICTPAYSECPLFPATTANVAAWNLGGFNPIARDKAETFASVITYLDPEALVLVEVNPDFIVAEIVAELNQIGICYKREILDQTASQNISILYKPGVKLSNPRLIPGSDNNNPHLRKAFACDMKIGEFDFILIGVHMKAGRNNSERTVRDSQAQAIANFIQNASAGPEKDMLIVGDYNMIPGQDQSNFDNMNPNDFLDFVSDNLADQFSRISNSGPGNLLDGYAISRQHTSEYITRSIRIIQMHDVLGLSLINYRNTVSDHLPLDAAFRITEDDD